MASQNNYQGAKIGFIVGSICILVLLISSSIFFLLTREDNRANKGDGNAVITPTSIVPTPTATPQLLFADNFVDTSKGWSLGSVPGYTRVISNGALILADTNHTILTESLPSSTTFQDFSITITFTILDADADDSVGLYLRGDSNLDHDYRIDFFGNKTYAISKEFLDENKEQQVQFLINPMPTTALKPVGQQNTVTVIMQGSTLILLMNGREVNTITDTDYTSGQIALFAQNSLTSREVQASFRSVVVYSVPEVTPTPTIGKGTG